MDTCGRTAVGRIASATAKPWSFGFWFVFTYMPPASLVGREAAVR